MNENIDSGLSKLVAAKNNIRIFNNLEDDEIIAIVKNIEFVKYNSHELIIKEHDESDDRIFFIVGGECRVSVGKENVGILESKQVFGEFSPLTKELRSASIRANTNAIVMTFRIDFDLDKNMPECFMKLYKNVLNGLIFKIDNSNHKHF